MMALRHLDSLRADREPQELMPEADAEQRGTFVSRSAWIVGTAYSPVAAGSPGPLESTTPSGLSAMMSSALAVAGTTVTAQPTRR